MISVAYHLYTLHSKRWNRQGALLRFQFGRRGVGYADCHPWEELGDLSLAEQLKLLKEERTTNLTQQSLMFATLDAQTRMRGISLLADLTIPHSHALIPSLAASEQEIDIALSQGFKQFKVKIGGDLLHELPQLEKLLQHLQKQQAKVRIDCNERLTLTESEQLFSFLKPYRSMVDFCEDPTKFVSENWIASQNKHGIPLACDRHSLTALKDPQAAQVLILKPAVQPWDRFLQDSRPLVITSYLDHPFGQCCAAYIAALCLNKSPKRMQTCGLLSHNVYQTNEWSAHFKPGPAFTVPPGTGFGFDDLLQKLDWKELS